MKSIVSFLGGIILTLVVLAGVGYLAVKAGIIPANADSKPTALENWVANTALDAAVERDTKGLKNPIQPSDENLTIGVHLYAEGKWYSINTARKSVHVFPVYAGLKFY